MNDIILTGPKHSGKTSAGYVLAASCHFIDLDELITHRTNKTPRQLYTESPAIFQKAETEALNACLQPHSAGASNSSKEVKLKVIAAGGGIIDNPEALKIIKKLQKASSPGGDGVIVVYLKISAGSAWERIANSANGELPPFLQTENPQETHRILHERRAALYQQLADFIIDTEGKTPEQIAAIIIGDYCR